MAQDGDDERSMGRRVAEGVTDGVVGALIAAIAAWSAWGVLHEVPCHPVWHAVGFGVLAVFGASTTLARPWARALVLGPLAILGILGLVLSTHPEVGSPVMRAGLATVSLLGPLAYLVRTMVAQESWWHRLAAVGAAVAGFVAWMFPMVVEPRGLMSWGGAWLTWVAVVVSAVLIARGRVAGILLGAVAAMMVVGTLRGAVTADVVAAVWLLVMAPFAVPIVRFMRRREG